jgi:basic membrane protein A
VNLVRASIALVAVAALATFLPARHEAAQDDGRRRAARIGLVFDVGGRGDKSFNDAAYIGLLRAQKELDGTSPAPPERGRTRPVDVSFLEPTGSEDREAALRLFAAQGRDLVIAVGFIFSSDVDAVARDYPGVRFACVDYAPGPSGPPPNVAGLVFREEEGSFLVGAAAGLLSRTHHVGFVGGMVTPLIRKFEAGYGAGVKATCAECTVHSGYAGTTPDAFKDPAKGKALAISEIAAGADVLYHASGATGNGVFEAAHDARAMAIGVDADQYDEMPDTVVTSMVKRMDVTVFEVIRDVAAGKFEGGMHVYGVKEGAIDWVHEGPHATRLPEDVKARVEELRGEIVAGRVVAPTE